MDIKFIELTDNQKEELENQKLKLDILDHRWKRLVYIAAISGVIISGMTLIFGYMKFSKDLTQNRELEAKRILLSYTQETELKEDAAYILMMAEAIFDLTYQCDDYTSWSNTVLFMYCDNESLILNEIEHIYCESYGEDFWNFINRNSSRCYDIQKKSGVKKLPQK